MPEHKRILAQRLVLDGVEHGLSLLEISGQKIRVTPFAGETHSTVFVNARVVVSTEQGEIVSYSEEPL